MWAFTTTATGTVDTLEFRTNGIANAGVTSVVLGIYADNGRTPTTTSAAIGQGTASGQPAIRSST
jgi:hypothetical protein